jgi:heptosyltransferase-1
MLHAVERNRALAAQALAYDASSPAEYGIAAPSVRMPDAWTQWSAQPYFALLHGTSARAKLWPEHQWIKLADHLHHLGFAALLPWGSEEERARCERIAKPLQRAFIVPRSPLNTLAALLAHAAGVFGVDTGLTHLAAALGRPTVGIYCATDPAATGLYGSPRAANVGGPGQSPSIGTVLAAWKQRST